MGSIKDLQKIIPIIGTGKSSILEKIKGLIQKHPPHRHESLASKKSTNETMRTNTAPCEPLTSYIYFLKEIYNLPIYRIAVNINDSKEFLQIRLNPVKFEACMTCMCNGANEFLVQFDDTHGCNNSTNSINSWKFPHVNPEYNKNPMETMNQWIRSKFGFPIDSVYPMLIIEYQASYGSEVVKQLCLLFGARIRYRKPVKFFTKSDRQDSILYGWIPHEQFLNALFPEDLIIHIINRIEQAPPMPVFEIDSHTETGIRYQLHRNTVAKLLYPLCSAKIRQKIVQIIRTRFDPSQKIRILDAACGDDTLLLELKKYFTNGEFICNDISHVDIMKLAALGPAKNVVFTNHDLRDLPFSSENNGPIFDVVILKNTLHHLKHKECTRVLEQLQRIGKLIIIVEIEDPVHSTLIARIWNFYYVHFLKDVGRTFVGGYQFKLIVKKSLLHGNTANFDKLHTIKGRYLFGIITNHSK